MTYRERINGTSFMAFGIHFIIGFVMFVITNRPGLKLLNIWYYLPTEFVAFAAEIIEKGKKAGEMNMFLFPTVLFYFFVSLLVFGNLRKWYIRKHPIKYLPCYKCRKSIKVWVKWVCDHCHNKQTEERYITDKCGHCKREIDIVYCEHCGEEIHLGLY